MYGILTFHRALNAGALLQAYALQQFMYGLGMDNAVVDYRNGFIERQHHPFKYYREDGLAKYAGRAALLGGILAKRVRKFDEFVAKHIRTSQTYNNIYALERGSSRFDAFIAGSDQVFSHDCARFDPAYFLTFAPDFKKFSYAASVGDSIPQKLAGEFEKRLQGFPFLSLREPYGTVDAEIHADPTLLLPREKWGTIAAPPREDGYVLLYTMRPSTTIFDYAEKLGREKGLKVIWLSDKYYQRHGKIEHKTAVSPDELLGWVQNASYVVTNSFHGTVFSVIFRRQFYSEAPQGKAKRITGLLNLLGLQARTAAPIDAPIDWQAVDERLEVERERSRQYLLKIKANTVFDPKPVVERDKCCGCRACQQICPANCVHMERGDNGFDFPVIDTAKCTNCGACRRACPVGKTPDGARGEVWAGFAQDAEIRRRSSSGGMFTLLAQEVIRQGGAVFGCVLDKDLTVRHVLAENAEELAAMRGSKYVQSDTGDTFGQTKALLKAGRHVLYSGLPCQIAGLKGYLGKDFENLLTVDLLCYGVPSPLVFKRHMAEKNAVSVNFRDKSLYGWHAATSYTLKDGTKLPAINPAYDPFMHGFFTNVYIRDCCVNCAYACDSRVSDITLGDFWDIDKRRDDVPSDGVSVVLANTSQGAAFLERLPGTKLISEQFKPITHGNRIKNPRTDQFFEDFDNLLWNQVVEKYLRPKLYAIRRLLRR
ncbi:hypothetical protein FACS1894217_02300 [Clostridia bacterium]|nr:hypothetical protein FACS1894217_02300 [Clostridia bacterium]